MRRILALRRALGLGTERGSTTARAPRCGTSSGDAGSRRRSPSRGRARDRGYAARTARVEVRAGPLEPVADPRDPAPRRPRRGGRARSRGRARAAARPRGSDARCRRHRAPRDALIRERRRREPVADDDHPALEVRAGSRSSTCWAPVLEHPGRARLGRRPRPAVQQLLPQLDARRRPARLARSGRRPHAGDRELSASSPTCVLFPTPSPPSRTMKRPVTCVPWVDRLGAGRRARDRRSIGDGSARQ